MDNIGARLVMAWEKKWQMLQLERERENKMVLSKWALKIENDAK